CNLPFKEGKKEVGYKDFLIINSIREFFKDSDETIIITDNMKDFSSAGKDNKHGVISLSREHGIDNLYMLKDISELSILLNKIKVKEGIELPWNREDVENKITDAISDIMYNQEIYGEVLFFDIDTCDVFVSVMSIKAESDRDSFMDITGKVKIQMDCSFTIDCFLFETLSDNFIFYKYIKNELRKRKIKDDDMWKIKFNKFHFCRVFDFNITDYDYKEGNTLDEGFLNLYSLQEYDT
ncbi:hypothetical protein, partial [Tatumella sp. OPLPL6]|uniref:hypothetical protein n=1 Tax=Tatumella sp. OPLPL6 TaxID=1928657 RepID=UPI000C36AC6D